MGPNSRISPLIYLVCNIGDAPIRNDHIPVNFQNPLCDLFCFYVLPIIATDHIRLTGFRSCYSMTSPKEYSAKRPYCFSLPERSLKNHQDAPAEWCDECDHFVDCQEAYDHRPKILTLHLKEVFFRQIQRGEKLHEYREHNDYWRKRLLPKHYDVIEICNAYPERGDLNNRMWFRYKGWQMVMMYHDPITDVFIRDGKQFFSISLESPIAYPYQAIEQNLPGIIGSPSVVS